MPPRRQPPECANPLFLQWLEELRDEARAKGLKIAETYNKACRSVAACPVAYDRPRDLAQLQGIGPKTVAVLDKRLRAHCKETGEPYPESPPKRARSNQPTEAGSDEEDAAPAPKKKRKPARAYIPQQGSGAYGILIGLLLNVKDPSTTIQVFLTKGELIRAAQPYSNSSYDHSERGTFVTAWGGMKTLINKGYVVVQGSPHRYSLTEDGYDVAVTLRNMHPDFADLPKLTPLERDAPPASASASVSPTRAPPARSSVPPAPPPPPAMAPATAPSSRRSSGLKFEFWYIDSSGNRVLELSAAKLRLCPDEFVTLRRIEFRAAQKSHPFVSQLRQLEETSSSVFAYIVEDTAPPRCSCFNDDDDDMLAAGPPARAASARPTQRAQSVQPAQPSRPPQPARSESVAQLDPVRARPPRTVQAPPSPGPATGPSRVRAPRLSSQLPLLGEERESPDFDPAEAITFPHGSYDVILILDTREIESRSSNRDKIAESLAAKNIKVETRALRLGDMCWVARRRDGHGDEEDECVLDYVVERKRLDDLCSSIRDGRYQDQCFRLTQSGIGNIFYIVEDWQTQQRMEFNGKQIMTAKSQIQVINGFFLKETHKLSDTIDFLATMTEVITASHRDLKIIPSKYISRTSYSALQAKLRKSYADTAFLTSFDAYQALNDKSASRTVRETLGRMLLCIKGMSPERVSALLEHWDTPRALYEAMVARHAQGAIGEGSKARKPENFFADQVTGEGRRKIGEALSRELWRCLWGNDDE